MYSDCTENYYNALDKCLTAEEQESFTAWLELVGEWCLMGDIPDLLRLIADYKVDNLVGYKL